MIEEARQPSQPRPDNQQQPAAQGQGRRHLASELMEDEVSDMELCRSVKSEEMDDLLLQSEGDPSDLDNKDHEVILANRQCDRSIDAILAREFASEEPWPSLPPVSEKLAKAVTEWMRVTPKREKIKEMFNETLVPENVEGLLPVRINEILYQRLPFKAKVNDQRLRGMNTYFARGLAPLVAVLDHIVQLESEVSGREKNWKSVDGNLVTEGYQIDVCQLRCLLSQAVKILSTGHSVLLTKRKGLLQPYLDQKFHFLLKPTNPVTQDLLGPDLEQKISDGARVVDAGRKLLYPGPKQSYTPRPRPQNPGHPYRGNFRGRSNRCPLAADRNQHRTFGRNTPYPQSHQGHTRNQQYNRTHFTNRGCRGGPRTQNNRS